MDRLLVVATPSTAVSVVLPARLPPPGLTPMGRAIGAQLRGTVLPNASLTLTWTAGAMLAWTCASVGCTEKSSVLAGPGEIVKGFVVASGKSTLEIGRASC